MLPRSERKGKAVTEEYKSQTVKMVEYLMDHPGQAFSNRDLAVACQVPHRRVSTLLPKAMKSGMIPGLEKDGPGRYRYTPAGPPPPAEVVNAAVRYERAPSPSGRGRDKAPRKITPRSRSLAVVPDSPPAPSGSREIDELVDLLGLPDARSLRRALLEQIGAAGVPRFRYAGHSASGAEMVSRDDGRVYMLVAV
jgi:hypothetical protein